MTINKLKTKTMNEIVMTEDKMRIIAERLRLAIGNENLDQKEAGRLFGLKSQYYMTMMLSGNRDQWKKVSRAAWKRVDDWAQSNPGPGAITVPIKTYSKEFELYSNYPSDKKKSTPDSPSTETEEKKTATFTPSESGDVRAKNSEDDLKECQKFAEHCEGFMDNAKRIRDQIKEDRDVWEERFFSKVKDISPVIQTTETTLETTPNATQRVQMEIDIVIKVNGQQINL